MVLQNIKDMKKSERGFTIIELLIVIVIIAILAAITIVAYNGVTTKANNSTAQGNASSVRSVAEAYNADNGNYPVLGNSSTPLSLLGYNGSTKLPSGVTAETGTQLTSSNGTNTVYYAANSGQTGACIGWYGYSSSGAIQWVYAGAATSGSVNSSYAVSCT